MASQTAPASPMETKEAFEICDKDLSEALEQVKIEARHANFELMARINKVFEQRHGREATAQELVDEFRSLRRTVFIEHSSSESEETEYDVDEYLSDEEEEDAVAAEDTLASSVDAVAVSPEIQPQAVADDANPEEEGEGSGSDADASSEDESDSDISLDEQELEDVQNDIHDAFENVSTLASKMRQQLKSRVLVEYLAANKRDATADEVDAVLYDLEKRVWGVEDESADEESSGEAEPLETVDEDDSEYELPSSVMESEAEESVVSDPEELVELVADADKEQAVVAITEQFMDGKPLPKQVLEAGGVFVDGTKPLDAVVEEKVASPVKPASEAFKVTLWSGETISVAIDADSDAELDRPLPQDDKPVSFLKMHLEGLSDDADWTANAEEVDDDSSVSGLEDDEWVLQLQSVGAVQQ